MRIAILCENEEGCRETHEPQEVRDRLLADLEKRLGRLNKKSSVLRHLSEVFDELVAEMRAKTVRVH